MKLRWLGIFRIAAWSLTAAIIILSLVPPELRPETGAPHALEHFSIYAGTGLAFSLGYSRRDLVLASLLVIFSGVVELAQLLVPGRHARLSDFVIDALAMSVGVAVGSLGRRYLGFG